MGLRRKSGRRPPKPLCVTGIDPLPGKIWNWEIELLREAMLHLLRLPASKRRSNSEAEAHGQA